MIVKWKMDIGYSNAIRSGEIEFDDEELEEMTKDEQDEYISECVGQAAYNYVDINWEIER